MMHLYPAIFKNLIKTKGAKFFLALGLLPLFVMISLMLKLDIISIDAGEGVFTGLGFLSTMVWSQHVLFVPVLMIAYFCVKLFYDEVQSGQLILFKDQPRHQILNAKAAAIFSLFGLYLLILFTTTLVINYTYIQHLPISTGTFFEVNHSENIQMMIQIAGYILMELMGIALAICGSIFLPSAYTMIMVLALQIIGNMAPFFGRSKYLFPTSYHMLLDNLNWGQALGWMALVAVVFGAFCYLVAQKIFKSLEY